MNQGEYAQESYYVGLRSTLLLASTRIWDRTKSATMVYLRYPILWMYEEDGSMEACTVPWFPTLGSSPASPPPPCDLRS